MKFILGFGIGVIVGAAAVMWLWWKSAEDEAGEKAQITYN